MRQGNLDPDTFFGFFPSARPLEQKPRQFFRDGVRQPKRTDHFISTLAVFAQMLRGVKAGIGMALQEFQKIIPLYEIQLAGLQSFRSQLVRFARDGTVKPEYFTRLCDSED